MEYKENIRELLIYLKGKYLNIKLYLKRKMKIRLIFN